MGAAVVVEKALIWLARRSKRVANHIALHNSERTVAAETRPWILRKAMHSVTLGGDRVTQKICQKTLKSFDHHVVQENGRHAFTKLFGRQIGRTAEQTAFRLIVEDTGKIVTGYAITAAQAAATAVTSVAGIVVLDSVLTETISGLNRIDADYAVTHPPAEEAWVEKIIDFFNDLGNDSLNENEGLMLAQDRYQEIMRSRYISLLQETQSRSIGGDDLQDLKAQFNEGVAGAAAPYVEEQG